MIVITEADAFRRGEQACRASVTANPFTFLPSAKARRLSVAWGRGWENAFKCAIARGEYSKPNWTAQERAHNVGLLQAVVKEMPMLRNPSQVFRVNP